MSDWAERRDRVLDVLERDTWLSRAQVREAARMDTTSCGWVLAALVAGGLVEQSALPHPRNGRRRALYRLAMRRAA